ncbi:MAG: DUF4270 family protein [Chitinophagaceae bacterium]|nr:DUF4270 family protein [Chitinophagaceae bacterium]
MLFFQTGCKKAYIQFGENFVDNNYTNIVMIDTISPVISTVFRDSVVTSQTGKLLLGSYKDPFFGHISSSSFFVMENPPAATSFHISATYDSMVMRLVGDSTFYGDTTVSQRLQVQQLNEMLIFPDNQTAFYNNSNFSVSNSILGAVNLSIVPSRKDTVNIRLNNTKGLEIWNLIQNKAVEVSTATDFEHYFPGLKISPENAATNAAIYGFSDTVKIRIYYHESNPDLVEKYLEFSLTSRNKQFNQVKYDRSGTPLNVAIPESKEIGSALLNNAAYIQPLTGALLKVRFPNVREAILQRTDYLQLMSAEITMYPLGGSYSYNYMLPSQLAGYTTNVNNNIGSALGANGSTSSSSAQYGDLKTDWLYGQDTYYTYNVSSYIEALLSTAADNTSGLLFMPPTPAYNTRFSRVVFGDAQSAKPMKLKLYYISVQKN